jgi:hypothetical protein
MAEIDAATLAAFLALLRTSEAVVAQIGLPDCLGGPDLPPEINAFFAATREARRCLRASLTREVEAI